MNNKMPEKQPSKLDLSVRVQRVVATESTEEQKKVRVVVVTGF